jgi:hypothetical protein
MDFKIDMAAAAFGAAARMFSSQRAIRTQPANSR